MLLIKSIEIIKTQDDWQAVIYKYDPDPYMLVNDGELAIEKAVVRELVRGEEFVNERGERVIVGWSEDVQKLIGLPFRAFENMRVSMKQIDDRNYKLRLQIEAIKNMTFWNRLKMLFSGYH